MEIGKKLKKSTLTAIHFCNMAFMPCNILSHKHVVIRTIQYTHNIYVEIHAIVA